MPFLQKFHKTWSIKMLASSQIVQSDLIGAANIPAVFTKSMQQWPSIFSCPVHKNGWLARLITIYYTIINSINTATSIIRIVSSYAAPKLIADNYLDITSWHEICTIVFLISCKFHSYMDFIIVFTAFLMNPSKPYKYSLLQDMEKYKKSIVMWVRMQTQWYPF